MTQSLYVYDTHYNEKERSIIHFGINNHDNISCWRWIDFPESIIYFQLITNDIIITREHLIDFYPALEEHHDFTFEIEPKTMHIAPVVSFTVSSSKTTSYQFLDEDTPSFITMKDNQAFEQYKQKHAINVTPISPDDEIDTSHFLRTEPVTIQVIKVIIWSSKRDDNSINDKQSLYQTPINRHSLIFSLAWLQTLNTEEYFTIHHNLKSFEWITVPLQHIKKVNHFCITSLASEEYVISYRDTSMHITTTTNNETPNLNIVAIEYDSFYPSFSLVPCTWNVKSGVMNVHSRFPSFFHLISSKPTSKNNKNYSDNNNVNLSLGSSCSSSSSSSSETHQHQQQMLKPTLFTKESDFEQACSHAVQQYFTEGNNRLFPIHMIISYRSDILHFIERHEGTIISYEKIVQDEDQKDENPTNNKKRATSKRMLLNKKTPFGILWCWTNELFKKPALIPQVALQSHSLTRLYSTYLNYTIHPRNFAFINWSILEKLDILSFLSECSHLTSCPFNVALKFQPSIMNMWHLLKAYYDAHFIIRQVSIERKEQEQQPEEGEYDEGEEEEQRKGGLQLSEKPGVYSSVIELDFNSCYPYIVWKSNIDYSTILTGALVHYDEQYINIDIFKKSREEPFHYLGVLPTLFANGVELRRQYRLRQSENKIFIARSNAVKQITNFIYGCLWQPSFRFYHPTFCQYITGMQRQVLQESATEFVNETIGGHTDSLLVALSETKEDHQTENIINRKFPELSCSLEHEFVMMAFVRNSFYAGITNDAQGVWKGCSAQQFGIAKFASQFRQKLLLDIMTLYRDQNGKIEFQKNPTLSRIFEQRLFIHLEELLSLFTPIDNHNHQLHIDELIICERLGSQSVFHLNNLIVNAPNASNGGERSATLNTNGFIAAKYMKLFHPAFHNHRFEEGDAIEYLMIKDYTNTYHNGRTAMPVLLCNNFKLDIDWYLFTHLFSVLEPILCSQALPFFSDKNDLRELLQSFAYKLVKKSERNN